MRHQNTQFISQTWVQELIDSHFDKADNAADGLRGLRAQPSPALFNLLRECYGLGKFTEITDLGGSSNLNLLVCTGRKRYVVRAYRPYVTSARVADIQLVRRALSRGGVPCSRVVNTEDGATWAQLGDRMVEVEDYVEHDAKMDSWERLKTGLPILGQIHTQLKTLTVSVAGLNPMFANSVEPLETLAWTLKATRRIREWNPSADELRFAQAAEKLAHAVNELEAETTASLPRQLVHGDFWDNNVFFRQGRVVLVADFDFMGARARIDDLALILYFARSLPIMSIECEEHIGRMRQLVDAYDAGLSQPLSHNERAALPVAMARQPLWALRWLALLDDQNQARNLAAEVSDDVNWALQLLHDIELWQSGICDANS